jgi:hypothetical protein
MNDISMKIKINKRRLIMAGVAFLAALHLPCAARKQTRAGKTHSLGNGYYAVNSWVVKKRDLA